jgi:S-DNA-T family DNA segregation ATPase FtsK/SpoIIIE
LSQKIIGQAWWPGLLLEAAKFFGSVGYEVGRGAWRGDMRLFWRLWFSIAMIVVALLGIDGFVLQYFGKTHFYRSIVYSVIQGLVVTSPVWIYGLKKAIERFRFLSDLKGSFDRAGLKNSLKEYPGFIGLVPGDAGSMKLRLKNNGLSLGEWESKRNRLEANLKIYIDNLNLIQEKGIVELTYATKPMPSFASVENVNDYRGYRFMVGINRIEKFEIDFRNSPHLLIGGETGRGKTYFVIQLIVTIKKNHPEAIVKILDFKRGPDFVNLKAIDRIEIASEKSATPGMVQEAITQIESRLQFLRENGFKDLAAYHESPDFRKKSLEERKADNCGARFFLIIDEFAEVISHGGELPGDAVRSVRDGLSKIARLGRAAGVHLILATQRPDRHVIDAQIKSNMSSTVCFRINDLGGSLAVLGTKKASELPNVAGRAIFQRGHEEIEVQTPFLEPSRAIAILEPHRKKDDENVNRITV